MRKSGPIPEYTIPMLGHITATFSSIESSIRIDDDFFSVAMTIPFEATQNMSEWPVRADTIGRYITLNTETCCPLRYCCQCMFDLHELPTGGEDCQRVAMRVQPDD